MPPRTKIGLRVSRRLGRVSAGEWGRSAKKGRTANVKRAGDCGGCSERGRQARIGRREESAKRGGKIDRSPWKEGWKGMAYRRRDVSQSLSSRSRVSDKRRGGDPRLHQERNPQFKKKMATLYAVFWEEDRRMGNRMVLRGRRESIKTSIPSVWRHRDGVPGSSDQHPC